MTGPTLRIEHADGTTDELSILTPDAAGDADTPSLQSLSVERKIARNPDETDRAECRVYRDAWQSLAIDPIDDTFIVAEDGTDIFGGRLRDSQREGVTVSVLLDGAKRDAIDAEPSAGNVIYAPQPDDALVTNELLPRTPTISAGTITEQTASIAFSEANAAPGASITKLAEATGSETVYRPDFSLDYIDRLGSDRTSETLSPSNGTVIGEPRIREQTVEDVTRIRVLGSQQGSAQVVAESVVTSSTSREVYRRKVDKDIQQQSRAQTLADELAAEYQDAPEYLEAETELPASVAPSLGDSFNLVLPAYDIDADLRIMTLERILDEAGDRFRAVLSNRKLTRDLEGDRQRRSVEEFRGGNAGQIVRDSDSQGFDKIDSGEPMAFGFRYPSDVIDEFEAALRIESRAYRRPAAATGHSHGFSVPDHTHPVTVSSQTTTDLVPSSQPVSYFTDSGTQTLFDNGLSTLTSYTPGSSETGWPYFFQLELTKKDGQNDTIEELDCFANANGLGYRFSAPKTGKNDTSLPLYNTVLTADDLTNEQIDVLAKPQTSSGGSIDVNYFFSLTAIPEHGHDISFTESTNTNSGGATSSTTNSKVALDPGIVTESTKTPSNVAVTVDGQQVASGLDHPIDTTVDIDGILDAGSNPIEATSDTLGELRLSTTIEALKNTGGS